MAMKRTCFCRSLAKMQNVSLRSVYLAVLSAISVVALFVFLAFDLTSQQRQSEQAMLEEARTFSREMDAVWRFMDNSQSIINTSSSGEYDFKGLHCAIVGKSVGSIFSRGSDYAIRYTNLEPRGIQSNPDDFEQDALVLFNEDSSVKEYSGIAEYKGEKRFRYVKALEVDQSCLECHGEPCGDIDITGHVKEGWTLDSVGGAISVVIPLDQHYSAMWSNVVRDVAFFSVLLGAICGVVFLVTRKFVLAPIDFMGAAFGKIGDGRLDTRIEDVQATHEISQLVERFNGMSAELRDMYSHLEEQVASRTNDLREANGMLESQRDSLAALSAKLSRESQFKTDLLSMVSHEFRTPLTSIITLCRIRLDEPALTPAERDGWEEVHRSGVALLEMVNNMLDIARSDANQVKVACEPMDLGDVVASLRHTVDPLVKKSRVSFCAHVASDVPLVNGDYEKTLRMLENLVSNAVKFTSEGGSVRLAVARERETGDVLVCLSDTGIGIAQADQERIFDRFVQVDGTSTRRHGGSGLGLALVREYADLQGFSVSVKSELGRGSTFFVRIPKGALIEGLFE